MAEMEIPLALVTGAAHRLGRALALHLAHLGYAILLHHHSADEEALDTVKKITNLGMPVYPFKADLTESAEIDSLFLYLDTLPHQLKILVNSAGVMQRGNILTLSVEEWDAALSLNLKTPFLISQRAAARMRGPGLIVNITDSGVGKVWTGFPAYLVSKSGLETLTRIQAKALAPNIRVNAIAPGLVLPAGNISEPEWQKLVDRLPLKRSTRPEDISSALEFLINNESVTGQTIVVDGGYSLI
jgi:NAD(P)-dependent dehydrogenase (short-subunit alcohol dehydrogenase family)